MMSSSESNLSEVNDVSYNLGASHIRKIFVEDCVRMSMNNKRDFEILLSRIETLLFGKHIRRFRGLSLSKKTEYITELFSKYIRENPLLKQGSLTEVDLVVCKIILKNLHSSLNDRLLFSIDYQKFVGKLMDKIRNNSDSDLIDDKECMKSLSIGIRNHISREPSLDRKYIIKYILCTLKDVLND